ncbi:LysR family nitrogen assimilation transcriptional regulator [Bradyrhizobium sp. USDA 4449]
MNLELLRLFVNVAEQGSLTKAAGALDTVQPVISRGLSALEKEIGGRLFHRNGRGVKLSPLGMELLPQARSLIQDSDRFLSHARSANATPSGIVRIGALDAFADPLIPVLYKRVQDEMPQVRLRIFVGPIGRIDEWLSDGTVDISLNLGDGTSTAGDRRRLGSVDTCLVGRHNDPLLRGPTVEFDALHDLPLVLAATSGQLRNRLEQIALDRGIRLNPVIEIDMLKFQLSLAALGGGYAVVTAQALTEQTAARLALSISRIVNPPIVRGILLGTSIREAPSLAVRHVHRLIQEIGADLIANGSWRRMGG